MAQKEFYHDINLLRVSQLKDFRVHNLTTTERDTLAAALGAANEGIHVWDTTEKRQYYWDGATFVPGVSQSAVTGGMVYKGAISDSATAPVSPEVGFTYVWQGGEATLTWAGQTFSPDAQVSNGDQIIYRETNTWDVFQADVDIATETEAGIAEIATQAEANAATADDKIITPAKLQGFVVARGFAKTYFAGAVNTTALTPFTVSHNLGLQNKDSYVISVKDSASSEIMVDVDSVDSNSLTITTNVSTTNLKVTVIGF